MPRWSLVVALALLAVAPAWAKVRSSGEYRFADIPPRHWALDHVRRVTAAGLMQGYEGKFMGNAPVNRYQMAQMMSRLMDRMNSYTPPRDSGGPSNEVVLQIADEVANLNVAQSNLEEKVVQLRHDFEALKQGEGQGSPHAAKRVSEEEWQERIRTQAPAGILAMLIFASASLLKTAK